MIPIKWQWKRSHQALTTSEKWGGQNYSRRLTKIEQCLHYNSRHLHVSKRYHKYKDKAGVIFLVVFLLLHKNSTTPAPKQIMDSSFLAWDDDAWCKRKVDQSQLSSFPSLLYKLVENLASFWIFFQCGIKFAFLKIRIWPVLSNILDIPSPPHKT